MDFKGYYNGVTTPLTIKGSGNVGIGTTSPGEKLEVSGSIQSSSYKISGATVLQGYTTVTVGSAGATGAVQLSTISGVGLILDGSERRDWYD
jgi:hypothetical protein